MMRLGVVALSIVISGYALAVECRMTPAFSQPDDKGKTSVAVWAEPNKAVLFGGSMHVNTDGTKRSYRVEDFWGTKDAVNNLCNAMSDRCDDLTKPQMRARRILTEQAKANGWQRADLAATKIEPKIIPNGPDGKPCAEKDGFMVSATALVDASVRDQCNPARYADAMILPAIVVPGRIKNVPTGFELNDAKVGDLAVVATRDLSKIVYAVVGDSGPTKDIGEGTIALARALLGKNHDPVNYREVRGRPPFRGQGWDVPQTITLILSGSRDNRTPYMTIARIEQDAASKFAAWGGVERLRACASVYRR
ncbi:MAG TPA: glycoside hydrolase family 75 protein [Bosea sp. (in: a-proteobacteria)]|jgi:hypothetical protein|uniref:glycoside hydrolase family 75 protein n=1 Tax=Bosea sp. (in: a-proteobacteria) TaxID=1871050 RepID=UPI002DDCC5DB|nr:glycoside hydrolase family 75 protein [Bosea sp. (in: a-proteobacteria)]HEV2553236.1 glycoside hydrolase family 75 protein [Bosea sp. (in: a-proteobacteria)]